MTGPDGPTRLSDLPCRCPEICGIAGTLTRKEAGSCPLDASTLHAMARHLAHRGPDAENVWLDTDAGIGLAHRRLSVLDLSAAGAQPMMSESGRYVIVFNGEIYNHLTLRQELEQAGVDITWRGRSDTETLLEAIAYWGLAVVLEKAFGMFALALWDRSANTLSLARDRTGEKPLYLITREGGVAFASELQAFHAVPGCEFRLDAEVLQSYLETSVVPDCACVLHGARKVRPGTILCISAADGRMRQEAYCDLVALMAGGRSAASRRTPQTCEEVIGDVSAILEEVVASQMISDVPLGSFLSGGIDSSLVTALMQKVSDRPVKTFTIGFEEAGYDESAHAERIAEHLGTEHRSYRLTEADALEIIPQLPRIYGEPFADSSQIPTALLCQNARQDVTVALTGDGGDEVFGGYNRHVLGPRFWSRLDRMPDFLRSSVRPMGRFLQRCGGGNSAWLRFVARRIGVSASLLDKTSRLGEIAADARSLQDVYRGLTRTVGERGHFLVSERAKHTNAAAQEDERLASFAAEEWMMAQDTLGYLPSDILVKVDRAAMHASLETRAPFLDVRTIEAAWRLPLHKRIRDGKGKHILREILDRHVPREMIDRPKQGFAVPIDRWLRGELRDWAESLLSKEALVEAAVLRVDPVRELWAAHLSRRGDYGQSLWTLLMLQAWLQHWHVSTSEGLREKTP